MDQTAVFAAKIAMNTLNRGKKNAKTVKITNALNQGVNIMRLDEMFEMFAIMHPEVLDEYPVDYEHPFFTNRWENHRTELERP